MSRRFAVPALFGGAGAVLLLAALTPTARGEEASRPTTQEMEPAAPTPPPPGPASPASRAPVATPVRPAGAAPTPATQGSDRCGPVDRATGRATDHDGRWGITWSVDAGCGGEAEIVGDVALTPDLSDVAKIAEGGRFVLELYDGNRRERLEVVGRAGGRLERTWTVNGTTRAWDAAGRRWMRGATREMLRFASSDVRQRLRSGLNPAGGSAHEGGAHARTPDHHPVVPHPPAAAGDSGAHPPADNHPLRPSEWADTTRTRVVRTAGTDQVVATATDERTGARLTLEARGVRMNRSARGVAEIRPGGYLVLEEDAGTFRRRLRIRPGPDGSLTREWSGEQLPEARRAAWEARILARLGRSVPQAGS